MFTRLSFRLAPKLCLITSRSGETDGIEERGIIELLRLLITAEPWGFKYLPTKKFWGLRSEALRWLRMIHLVRGDGRSAGIVKEENAERCETVTYGYMAEIAETKGERNMRDAEERMTRQCCECGGPTV